LAPARARHHAPRQQHDLERVLQRDGKQKKGQEGDQSHDHFGECRRVVFVPRCLA
jgi:hypothetical protein